MADVDALAIQVAQAPYTGPKATCPWVAVHPLAQSILISKAKAFLEDALPILIQQGWTPPKETP